MTNKKDKKEKVKRIDDSTDTEETCSQSSDSEIFSSDSEESFRQVREILPMQKRKQTEKLTIHAIRPGRRTRQLHRTGKEFEFKITLNGKKMVAILDTGSPISILPKKYHNDVRPKRVIRISKSTNLENSTA